MNPDVVGADARGAMYGGLDVAEAIRLGTLTELAARPPAPHLEMFADLGDCYAERIRAACDLAMFDATAEASLQQDAIRRLASAADHWRSYAEAYARQYRQRVLYNRVGWVDRTELLEQVRADLELARGWKVGSVTGDVPARPASPRSD